MDWERFADAQCELLGLTLTPEQRGGVLRYLALAGGIAPRVLDFPLAPVDESGSVLRPVEPGAAVGAGKPT